MSTELTICMPAYNAGEYIKDAVESVLNQTYGDFRFVIYNDGSADNTADVIKSFDDKRINVIDCTENKGGIYARSKLIESIDTEYCMWIDADDRFSRDDAFEECMNIMKAGGYDLVNFARDTEINSDGTSKTNYNGLYGDFSYCGDRLFEKFYPTDNHCIFHSKVFKTELIKKSVPYDVIDRRFCSDDWFFSALWFYCSKRYLHIVDAYEPIYEYKNSVGIWGAKTKDVSLKRIGDLCLMQYNYFISLYNRMNAVRNMTPAEFNSFLGGVNLMMIPKMISSARKAIGDEYADKLSGIWHLAFAKDGVHLLNGIDMFAMPEYIKKLEDRMK